MERITKFSSGHDCVKFECINDSDRCAPGKGGSHGKSGLSIIFISKGDAGAVQFVIYTGWVPQLTKPDSIGWRSVENWGNSVMPADLGYHSKKELYEGQDVMQESCEYCDGQPCYYDGSGLNANDAMYALVNGGSEALWIFLDAYYEHTFNGAEYPVPAEYSKNLR